MKRSLKGSVRRGFTLVELLVVIGIIAVLVGILLPTLSRAREQANTVACAAQLRGLVQGVLVYASENKGSLPYSFVWDRIDPADTSSGKPDPAGRQITVAATDGNNYKLYAGYHWWTLISDLSTKGKNGGTYPGEREFAAATSNTLLTQVKLTKAFRCPTVNSNSAFDNVVNTYAANMVAMPNQSWELAGSGNPETCRIPPVSLSFTGTGSVNWAIAPAKSGQLANDNALLWDTPLRADSENTNSLYLQNMWGGLTISGIDNGLLLDPLKAYQRYRGVAQGRYNPSTHKNIMPDQPIYMSTDPNANNDVIKGYASITKTEDLYNALGGVRFRHQRNTLCNVAFADGSVRGLSLNVKQTAWTVSGVTAAKSDFLRGYLMIKRPPVLRGAQKFLLP